MLSILGVFPFSLLLKFDFSLGSMRGQIPRSPNHTAFLWVYMFPLFNTCNGICIFSLLTLYVICVTNVSCFKSSIYKLFFLLLVLLVFVKVWMKNGGKWKFRISFFLQRSFVPHWIGIEGLLCLYIEIFFLTLKESRREKASRYCHSIDFRFRFDQNDPINWYIFWTKFISVE